MNKAKCKIAVDSVFSKEGVCIDPEKVRAITSFKEPENVDELTRWLGMVTYVGKVIPLRILQCATTAWHWDKLQ